MPPGGGTPTMLGPAVIIRGMSAVRMIKRERKEDIIADKRYIHTIPRELELLYGPRSNISGSPR